MKLRPNKAFSRMIFASFSAWVVLLLTSSQAWCDLIWIEGRNEQVAGQVIAENENEIVFRFRDGERERDADVQRSQIRRLVRTIDAERLRSLNLSDFSAYLEYAEELAGFENDPFAIDLAKRLCLIVAYWSRDAQRHSAFQLLISLCDNQERLRVQHLAFIFDPAFNMPSPEDQEVVSIGANAHDTLKTILVLIRSAQAEKAVELLQQERIKNLVGPLLEKYTAICSALELESIAMADRLSVNQLAQILQLEKALIEKASRPVGARARQSWAADAAQVVPQRELLPEFTTVLPLDPRQAIYRNGVWVEPTR